MNVLLAVDTSDATLKAVDFVGRVLAGRNDARLTVVHVVESLPDHYLLLPSRKQLRGLADVWEKAARESGEELLADVERRLAECGMDPADVECRILTVDALPEASKVSAASGIIVEMQSGNYDVVCLGRRGTSPAEGSFVGSVAQHVLREARGVTVWVVD